MQTMDWIRWIALFQPIILSLALVFFRPQWIGLQQDHKGRETYIDSSADVVDIKEKLKYLEENAVSSKNFDGLEESISDLNKKIGELQKQTQKYSKQEGTVNSSHGNKTNIGLAALALIQLVVVVCIVMLWRKVLTLQAAQKGHVDNMKVNNNMKTPTTSDL